jgi:hypothetical protein
MRPAPEKHLALWTVFLAGVLAAVYGIYLLVGLRHVGLAAGDAAGGLALIAWVMFHPARVENVQPL